MCDLQSQNLENLKLEIAGNGALVELCWPNYARSPTSDSMGRTLRLAITGIWRYTAANHWKRHGGKYIVYCNALSPMCKIIHLLGHNSPLRFRESFNSWDCTSHSRPSSFKSRFMYIKLHINRVIYYSCDALLVYSKILLR